MSRVVLALLMSVGVGTHVYLKVNTQNPQWFIYMTNQVGILFKSIVQIFPGNRLAGSPLHRTCLAGPLCKVQVVVAVFFPSREYSRRSKLDGSSLPFLYKLSWGLEVKDVHYFHRAPLLSSEHGVYHFPPCHCFLLDSGTSCCCGVRLVAGLSFIQLS